jgi:hypothetical protein
MIIHKHHNGLKKFLNCRRGAAEIVGSIMFLLILLFFFTNVYLWHDVATRQMDGVLADKMNSLVSIQIGDSGYVLNVTNNGGVGVVLSRLWIISPLNGGHYYAELEQVPGYPGGEIWIEAGSTIELYLYDDPLPGSPIRVEWMSNFQRMYVFYTPQEEDTFKILTTLGNSAACKYLPPPSP